MTMKKKRLHKKKYKSMKKRLSEYYYTNFFHDERKIMFNA